MLKLILLFAAGWLCTPLYAQNDNQILDDDLHAVQLYLTGAPLTLPVLALSAGGGALTLEFDRGTTDIRD